MLIKLSIFTPYLFFGPLKSELYFLSRAPPPRHPRVKHRYNRGATGGAGLVYSGVAAAVVRHGRVWNASADNGTHQSHSPLALPPSSSPDHRLTHPVCSPTAMVTWYIPPPATVFQSPGDSGSSMSPLLASSHFPSPHFRRRTPDTTTTLSRSRLSLDSYMRV